MLKYGELRILDWHQLDDRGGAILSNWPTGNGIVRVVDQDAAEAVGWIHRPTRGLPDQRRRIIHCISFGVDRDDGSVVGDPDPVPTDPVDPRHQICSGARSYVQPSWIKAGYRIQARSLYAPAPGCEDARIRGGCERRKPVVTTRTPLRVDLRVPCLARRIAWLARVRAWLARPDP